MSIHSFFKHVNDDITDACCKILTSKPEDVLTFQFKDSPESFCQLFNKAKHVGNLTFKTKDKNITCKMLTLNGSPVISVDLDLDKRIILKQKDLKVAIHWKIIF